LDELIGDRHGTNSQRTECLKMINKSRKLRIKEEVTSSKLLKNVSDSKALNERDEKGRNALHRSLLHNNRKAAITLISTRGIDMNAMNNCGSSPLSYAAVKNNILVVKLLLASPNVELNSRDKYDRTPLMVALKSQSREVVKLLLKDHRVEMDNDGSKLEDWICGTSEAKIRYFDMIKSARKSRMKEKKTRSKLMQNQYDTKELNENDEIGLNFLNRSLTLNDRKSTFALLMNPGIDVNAATTAAGTTPLIFACEYNNYQTVELLLKAPGIQVNKPDKKGRTPIMTALAWCSKESIKLLANDLRVDLDQRIKTPGGRTLDQCVGFFSAERGYGQYGQAVKQECSNILHDARKIRGNVSELQKKIEEMEIQKVESHAAIQKTLECPICLENMKPPTRIWMCSLSHIVCEPCKNKLENNLCPKCRTKRVTLRAFMAEHFAEAVFT